jgi:oligopeptide/dipeptide ABC transporter ATP-binding protein
VRNLVKYFPIRAGLFSRVVNWVRAADDVSFAVHRGETLGLVGESGCGKTTVGRTVLRLYEPTAGEILFDGVSLTALKASELRAIRRRMQIMFQDPFESLNPRMTVGKIMAEPLRVHGFSRAAQRARTEELIGLVGLSPQHVNRYPHEFSGGQRQRIGLARAIALNPDLIVCDEPVSALDVSIQAQVINLLMDLQERLRLTYLFIAHDLSVVRHISDRVAVMYLGRLVEVADAEELFEHPLHLYTEALLSAIPVPDPAAVARMRQRILLEGDVPSPVNPPPYCRFYDRGCRRRMPVCRQFDPALTEVTPGHTVACFAAFADFNLPFPTPA